MSSSKFARPLVTFAAVGLVVACASEAAKQGVTPGVAATGDSVSSIAAASSDTATPRADSVPAAADSVIGRDSAIVYTAPTPDSGATKSPSPAPRLAPGRGKQDAGSFAAVIRRGEAQLASWPAGPTAAAGALFPDKRVVAYYGNPHSKRMGVLGEYPEAQMLGMLDKTVAAWQQADPSTPVVPAIHLVSVVADGFAGPDGMWRHREGAKTIEQTYGWAKSRNGLLFLDIQGGHSTLQAELPPLLKYLERPDVHLGVDPEFYMHHKREGVRPSAKVGQMLASDVNYVIQTLDRLVAEKKLPPKILVVHRFRQDMVPDAEGIRPTKNVQVVMDMDGWGPPWLKFDSYHHYIVNHPVQYAGFKLFYHNDTKKGDALLTPSELLQLKPRPMYIQYQ